MDKHLKVCSKREVLQNGNNKPQDSDMIAERLAIVEENLMFLRKSLNDEIQMRLDLISEFGSLKRRNQVRVVL